MKIRPPRMSRTLVTLALCGALLGAAAPGLAHDHESTRSGHPLRILAYVLHPVGVVLDTLIMRPFHWLGSHEPVQTLFGHEEDD